MIAREAKVAKSDFDVASLDLIRSLAQASATAARKFKASLS